MRAFWAIVKLTLRNAMRSHVFQLLLLLLLLCVGVIPASIGGGTAQDFIRVSLFYSIWAVGLVLSLSSLWLGCFVMAHDVDSYQLHMVVAKPVSRVVIWLGKWTGINLINFVLLFISMGMIYGIIFYRYKIDDRFTPDERRKIASEVLVGRRVFKPEIPDFEALARRALVNRMEHLKKQGGAVLDSATQEKMYQELLQSIAGAYAELPIGAKRYWLYKNIPEISGEPLYIRFRPYVSKVSSDDQRKTYLWWSAVVPSRDGGKTPDVEYFLTRQPEQLLSGTFYERMLPPELKVVSLKNEVRIGVANFDPYRANHYYQLADGPKLLVKMSSFEGNYLRAVLVMMLQLALLSALACAFGGFLTMPTAIFMVISYLLFGSFSTLLTDQEFYASTAWDHLGQALAKLLLMVVIPLQGFDVTDLLSSGELIEFAYIGKLFLYYFVLRGMPLFLLGIWLYRRRELGLAVRK